MGNIFPAIGWIAWVFVFYLAVVWALGCRKYARAGKPFTFMTATRTMYLCCVSLLFSLLPGVYKLHILWVVPLIFSGLFSYYMQGVPLVIFLTWVFIKITLLGVQTPLEKVLSGPPPNIFRTPFSAVLKADLVMMCSLLKTKKKSVEKPEVISTPLGSVSLDKIELIRNLVKRRVQSDPATSMSWDVASIVGDIESFSEIELMGLPEATIVTIIETYWQYRTQRRSDKEIFEAIENFRSRFDDDTGTLPSQLNLSNYIKYRLRLEHYSSPTISDNFIDDAIKEATRAFTQ